MPLSNGQILQQRYRILRPLGQGGMGAVYLAQDLRLAGRLCAVKENVPDPAANQQTLAQLRQQFQAEASVLATLDHPNLPKVSDFFVDGVNEYLVMDFVEGQTLEKALADHMQQQGKPLPEKPVLIWASQVLDALVYLHGRVPPVIHRDIKPANIVLTPQGTVKLVDFGLVKLLNPGHGSTATAMRGMGTPEYTPLEQYPGSTMHTDARSDIYALGATLYHLLTGVAPATVVERSADPKKLVAPRQVNPALSAGTEAALLKAMQIRPDQRFQTADEMRRALAGQGSRKGRRINVMLLLIVVVLVLLALGGYGIDKLLSDPTPTPAGTVAAATVFVLATETTLPVTPTLDSATAALPRPTATPAPLLGGTPTAAVARTATAAYATAEAFRLRTATPTATLTPTPDATATEAFEIAGRIATAEALGLDPDSIRIEKDGMELVYVPAGEFLMGSAESDSEAESNEQPQHRVYMDAFWVDKTEVTNAMFMRFVEESGYQTEAESGGCGSVYQAGANGWECMEGATWQHPHGPASDLSGLEQHPVVQVSWKDARAYCEWVGRRLPTEAEWEKAARGTDGRVYAWGNVSDGSKLNFCDRNCPRSVEGDSVVDDGYIFTALVANYPAGASPFGALDMAGNVWEWTGDWYDDNYYTISPGRNPTGPAAGENRVLRGGSWVDPLRFLRTADRHAVSPNDRFDVVGFRCARSP